jgi:ribosomal-protein-alanine N-acetyltransferase
MADLHAAAFATGEAWASSSFADLLKLPTTFARGVMDQTELLSFAVVQFVAGDAEILTIATAPSARQQGFARAILQYLERELVPKGLEKWLLEVAADNAGALQFYRQLGFKIDGERRNYYKRLEGAYVNAILMSKARG